MFNSKFRRHVVSRGAQCPEDDMERNVGESKLFKGVQVICSITALKLKKLHPFRSLTQQDCSLRLQSHRSSSEKGCLLFL